MFLVMSIMNKYPYRTYLMSKLINTLFLAIVIIHVPCSLRIYFIIHKIV